MWDVRIRVARAATLPLAAPCQRSSEAPPPPSFLVCLLLEPSSSINMRVALRRRSSRIPAKEALHFGVSLCVPYLVQPCAM